MARRKPTEEDPISNRLLWASFISPSALMDVLSDEILRLANSQQLLRGCIQQSELSSFLP
jgi:hypothetical protein